MTMSQMIQTNTTPNQHFQLSLMQYALRVQIETTVELLDKSIELFDIKTSTFNVYT